MRDCLCFELLLLRRTRDFILRLRTSCPATRPEGLTVGKHFIPGDTICGISALVMNHSTEALGDDAEEWQPEQWLKTDEKSEKRIKEMDHLLTTVSVTGCIK